MRRVSVLAIDDVQVFDDITASKAQARRRCLEATRKAVLAAYEGYAAEAPNVENLPAVHLTTSQRKALIHAYEVETLPMTTLRGKLLNRVLVARCPFCGLGESSTLDHYLPKEKHPQFAILTKNLVPSCGRCNNRKRQLVVDNDTNVRLFLHPYFDEIPDENFLHVDLTLLPDALGLSYRLVRARGMDQRTFRHLKSHFSLLRLADRYRLMSLEHLRDRYRALARFYGPGEDAERVAAELNQDADDLATEHGPNDWRATLYRALAADDVFCDGGFEVLRQVQ